MEFLRENLSKLAVGVVFIVVGILYYKSESLKKNDSKKENVSFKVTQDQNNQNLDSNQNAKEKNNNEKSDSCNIVTSESEDSTSNSAMTEEKVKSIVKQYIESNPEIIISSLEKYQKDKEIDLDAESQKRILEKKDAIDSIKKDDQSYLGSKESSSVIVMFLDYNCDYCKRAGSVVSELLELDPKIKVVVQQYPILGGTSLTIAKIVAYVSKNSPDKFSQVHNQMLLMKSPTEQDLREYVFKNNIGNFDDIIENDGVRDAIEKSKNLGSYIGVQGVPGFVIQDKLIPGLISIDQIRELIKDNKDNKDSAKDSQ